MRHVRVAGGGGVVHRPGLVHPPPHPTPCLSCSAASGAACPHALLPLRTRSRRVSPPCRLGLAHAAGQAGFFTGLDLGMPAREAVSADGWVVVGGGYGAVSWLVSDACGTRGACRARAAGACRYMRQARVGRAWQARGGRRLESCGRRLMQGQLLVYQPGMFTDARQRPAGAWWGPGWSRAAAPRASSGWPGPGGSWTGPTRTTRTQAARMGRSGTRGATGTRGAGWGWCTWWRGARRPASTGRGSRRGGPYCEVRPAQGAALVNDSDAALVADRGAPGAGAGDGRWGGGGRRTRGGVGAGAAGEGRRRGACPRCWKERRFKTAFPRVGCSSCE